MSLSIAQIVEEFGARYVDNGPGVAEILKKIRSQVSTSQFFTPIPTDRSHVRTLSENMSARVQAFQTDFTPAGNAEIQGNEHRVYQLKIDESITPDELLDTYIGYLAERKLQPEDMPFTKYMVEVYLEDATEKLEAEAYYHGVYNEPTPGTPGLTSECMDGLGVQISSAITAGKITPITTVAITDEDSAEAAFKQFTLGLGSKLNAMDYIFMSATNAQLLSFKKDRRHDGSGKEFNPLAPVMVPYGNKMIVGLTSMGSSDRIWATPKNNRAHYYNTSKRMMMQPNDRKVKLLIDWNESLVLRRPQLVFCNDKA